MRGHNEGSIYQRASDGLWVAGITLDGGKRKAVYGKTRQEAADKLAKLLREKQQGLPVTDDRQTVEQYLTGWLDAIKPHLRPRSYVRYEDAVRLHILPTLGKVKLSKLTARQIEAMYSAQLGQGFAPATVQRTHAVLRKALNDAVRYELLARNVASHARAPRVDRTEMDTWTADQARTFLHAVAGDSLEAFYALAINTGMRRGELLALHWDDVHLDDGYAQVRFTLQDETGGRFTFAPPKTDQSTRRVPLNQTAIAALRRHRARQNAQRLEAGDTWQDSGLVFTSPQGGPLRGNHILERHFEPLCKQLGLPRIRLHDLRHTAASLWYDAGYQTEVVSKLLGHSSTTVTSNVYIHVTRRLQQDATDALDKLFA